MKYTCTYKKIKREKKKNSQAGLPQQQIPITVVPNLKKQKINIIKTM